MIKKFKIFEENSYKSNEWKLILDISKIWNENIYDNNNYLVNFNDQFINFLNNNKNVISEKTSEESWNNLSSLIFKLNENKSDIKKSSSIWNDMYDWADSNMVQIMVEKKEDFDF